jgi:hypothetical protein
MGDERMFERLNVFTTINKVTWTAEVVQNNPPNYVTNYETDFYHSQIKPLLLLLRLLGVLPIEIGKFGVSNLRLPKLNFQLIAFTPTYFCLNT